MQDLLTELRRVNTAETGYPQRDRHALTCCHCGSRGVILSGLTADTFHERLTIGDRGIKVSSGGDGRPLIRFRLHCVECSANTSITVYETSVAGGVQYVAGPEAP